MGPRSSHAAPASSQLSNHPPNRVSASSSQFGHSNSKATGGSGNPFHASMPSSPRAAPDHAPRVRSTTDAVKGGTHNSFEHAWETLESAHVHLDAVRAISDPSVQPLPRGAVVTSAQMLDHERAPPPHHQFSNSRERLQVSDHFVRSSTAQLQRDGIPQNHATLDNSDAFSSRVQAQL